ncbi:NUDIX domain-containing protein [Halanaeroarchaeum sulfurireducens]|uniref:Initiation factor 2B related protein n=1 Tax=Halanaeroarchaeum sulfurireducens TaxID=1604004 RepID=A0A0F7P9N4_9EURY|nr:NUDIX domain-containing protein [Halanaeroarchaeum sulfurireducens]AKH96920.1 initiation factor 2B related protein [Halanaeroarchaeum sulfurireducens]ALG81322.1 initiation factor 2B related protein [Halanaeroarchaeum sulfurireducens]
MDETRVVTVFLRNDADVLFLRRSDAVGSYTGRWGTVAGHAEGAPDSQALDEIREETSIDPADVAFVRRGERFAVEDADLDTRWLVTPYLFDVSHREVEPNEETTAVEWAPPTAILRRETVPDLWKSYWRVAPTVETVRADEDHGSAYVSLRALEVLRDAAALAVERGKGNWDHLAKTAQGLLDARPSMAAVRNRVNRVLSVASSDRTSAAVERAATDAIGAALAADWSAAETARKHVDGERVVTLSRSGTVFAALSSGAPASVVVAESRPGGEGVGVAEDLADEGLDVTLTTDANVPAAVADATVCLFGADTVLPDGSVVNKVGSRAMALASRDTGIPCYAVCASDKIAPDSTIHVDDGDPETLYRGDADLTVDNPTFERVPASLLNGVITEADVLDDEQIESLSAVHAARANWSRTAHPEE